MKFTCDTPSGKGIFVKAFYKHHKKYARVSFTRETFRFVKKGLKSKKVLVRSRSVKDFLYSECTIHKADSPFTKWLKKLFKS